MSVKENFSFIFRVFCFAFLLPYINAVPVLSEDGPFERFVEFLMRNNCSMPMEVDIPFPITDSTPFSYLFTPLKECQSQEALKDNNKANLLCREVFDVLQNITCNEHIMLPKINSSRLSVNICKDFIEIQDILPEQNEYLSRKLGDSIICKVLCTEKYELLCKTLLWSYDTQAKIKKAVDSKSKENEKANVNSIIPSNGLQEEIPAIPVETGVENQKEVNEIPDKSKSVSNLEDTKKTHNESSLNNIEGKTSLSNISFHEKTVVNKSISSLSSNNEAKSINSNNTSQIIQSHSLSNMDALSDTQKAFSKSPLNENSQPGEQSPEVLDRNIDQEESGVENQPKNAENPVSEVNPNIKIGSVSLEIKDNQNGKSNTSLISITDNGNNSDKPDEKTSFIPETEVNSGLNNVGPLEPTEIETKYKEKQADLKKKEGNSKESSSLQGASLETDLNLLSSTPLSVYSDKNEDLEQHSEVKDPELYNDSENDGDYAKQEYDNGFSPSLKKDIKSSLDDGFSQISSSSSNQINAESFPGSGLDGSRNYLPARNYLPEQEDSHFFFYFLSIVLILMAGYLIFHNKQKIIALIVEGRHERRRRSHGAGYKKLETK